MAPKPTVTAAPKFTRKQLDDAASDARDITQDSKIVQAVLTSMIASRRLYMLCRSVLDNELANGWEVDNPDLVVQTLVLSAQERSTDNFSVLSLQQNMLATVIPFIDICVQQEAADVAAKAAEEKDDESGTSVGATSDEES